MAVVRAVHALRYDVARVGDLSRVIAPPYDVITSDEQDALYDASPYNVIRLILPREAARAEAASRTLREWMAGGILVRDPAPAVFLYAQTFTLPDGSTKTREGVLLSLGLEEFSRGVVLPHEKTLPGPKADRLAIIRATGANLSPIFGLYARRGECARDILGVSGPPLVEATNTSGGHRLWRVTDAAAIARFAASLADERVIIADGHHRYETAVEYARRHPGAGEKLLAFFALEAPGLTILPNHRLLHGVPGFSLSGLAGPAREWFEVTPLDDPLAFRPARDRLGVVTGEGAAVLTLRDGADARIAWPAGTSAAWRGLAVSILHEGLLRPLVGITDAMLDERTHVDYTADQGEAVALVRAGRYQAAFLIAPTTPAELQAVVRGGEVLPQKSTHFYPKLLDGLVFHRLGD
jgi:uncharacterized protein (DUF1015 family)